MGSAAGVCWLLPQSALRTWLASLLCLDLNCLPQAGPRQVAVPYVPLFLPQETEELEEEKSGLQKEIAELQKEKEKLEFMLVAHGPVCKISPEERRSPPSSGLQPLRSGGAVVVKQEPPEEDSPSSSSAGLDKGQRSVIKPISIAGGFYMEEPLHTPIVVTSTPAITPGTSNLVFTYPSVLEQESPASPSESCSKAHRRSSSSGDQSSDSLNSPTLLAL